MRKAVCVFAYVACCAIAAFDTAAATHYVSARLAEARGRAAAMRAYYAKRKAHPLVVKPCKPCEEKKASSAGT